MNGNDTIGRRRFYRDSSRAMIAGVCAGLADYFGFNLRVTRILAVISLLMAFPATMLAYFGIVFLVPAAPKASDRPDFDEEFRRAVRSNPRTTMAEVGSGSGTNNKKFVRARKVAKWMQDMFC